MDLDKIKEIWKENDIKPSIGEDKIYKMLDNKGKSALNGLLRFEKISVCLLPFFIFAPFIHNHYNKLAPYPLFSIILFIGLCIIGFFWQLYKIRLLKKIDPEKMDVILYSKHIALYRKYISYEIIVGICWLIAFVLSYFFSLTHRIPGEHMMFFIIFMAVLLIISVIIIVLFYKWLYTKKIKEIERNIKEIEEFEHDNN